MWVLKGTNGGVEPVRLDVDAGEPGGADEALEVTFARAPFERPGPRTTERSLQGAGGRAGRRGDVFDEAVGAAGAQDAADLGEDVGGVGHRAEHERGDHAVDAVVGQAGALGDTVVELEVHARCARRRPAAVGACGGWVRWRRAWPRRAGSGGWRPLRSRARRPSWGSSPKRRRLCVRRFHSMYGSIRLKKAALKRPRAPCTSNAGRGGHGHGGIDHESSLRRVVGHRTVRRSARRVRRGTTPTSKALQGRFVLGDVPGGDLGARPEPQAQADPFDVTLGGTLVDAQARRDLAVGAPLAHQGAPPRVGEPSARRA